MLHYGGKKFLTSERNKKPYPPPPQVKWSVPNAKAYQLLAHGRWFSPASSATITGRHDIAEILLKVALSTKNQINQSFFISCGGSK
jgi:hypothetical protein